MSALRELLNTWDPIGVVGGGGPQDEYDCLIAPMLDQMKGGTEPAELAAFLRSELEDHFGMDPEHHAAGIEAVSQAAVKLRARG